MKLSRIPVTIWLIVVNVAVFAWEVKRGAIANPDLLIDMGSITPGMLSNGEWWRLVSAMFLHVTWLHAGLNLWALYQLGGVFEMMFGSSRFALTYMGSGLIASLVSAFFVAPDSHSAGASGAIFGILGALIFSIKRSPYWRHQPWVGGFIRQLLFWAGINIVFGILNPRIDNAAHMGGFAAGLAFGFVPHRVPPPPPGGMTIEVTAGKEPEAKA